MTIKEKISLIEEMGYTLEEFEKMIKYLEIHNSKIKKILECNNGNWKKMEHYLLKQIPEQYKLCQQICMEVYKEDVFKYTEEIYVYEANNLEKNLLPKIKNKLNISKYETVEYEVLPNNVKANIKKTILTLEEKLQLGQELTNEEIENMCYNYKTIYEEYGEKHRWYVDVLTVVEISKIGLFAIEWQQGLTEREENFYENQPYKCNLKEKEVIVKQTFVEKI